jgi:hypothetical protein
MKLTGGKNFENTMHMCRSLLSECDSECGLSLEIMSASRLSAKLPGIFEAFAFAHIMPGSMYY